MRTSLNAVVMGTAVVVTVVVTVTITANAFVALLLFLLVNRVCRRSRVPKLKLDEIFPVSTCSKHFSNSRLHLFCIIFERRKSYPPHRRQTKDKTQE
jgi:hypothetical protein